MTVYSCIYIQSLCIYCNRAIILVGYLSDIYQHFKILKCQLVLYQTFKSLLLIVRSCQGMTLRLCSPLFPLFLYPLLLSHISPPLLYSLPVYHLLSATCHCHSSYIVGALSQRMLTSFSFGSLLTDVHFHLVVTIPVSDIYF